MKGKKMFLFLLVGIMVLSLVLAGCSSNTQSSSGEKPKDSVKPKDVFIKIATGNTGGTYYPVGVAMGQMLSKKIPGAVSSAMSTGGSVDNIGLLRSNEAQIAMIMSTVANDAYFGEGQFKDKKYEDLRTITTLWANQIQVVVSKDVKSWEDLKGKRFVVGAAKSGTETDSYALLASMGLYYRESDGDKKNITPVYVNYEEAVEAMKNRKVDGILNNSNPPASSISDLMSTGDFRMLSLTQEQMDALAKQNPLYAPYTIKAGTYPNQNEDILVAGYPVLLLATAQMPAEDVYNITKAIFENRADLIAAHKAAEAITLETATTGVRIPFHDGAKKYLEEKGVKAN